MPPGPVQRYLQTNCPTNVLLLALEPLAVWLKAGTVEPSGLAMSMVQDVTVPDELQLSVQLAPDCVLAWSCDIETVGAAGGGTAVTVTVNADDGYSRRCSRKQTFGRWCRNRAGPK